MGRVGDVFSPPLDDLRKIPIHFASLSQIAQVAGAIVAWEDVGALHTSSSIEMTASALKLGQYRRYSDTDITLTRGQTHAI